MRTALSTAERTLPTIALALLAFAGLATACAKRPAMTEVSAPAPTGAAVTTPAPAPAPVAPTPAPPPAPAPAAPAPAAPAPAAPPPAVVEPRPAPAEYSDNPALADIHFDFDKSAIRPADARVLDASAAWLKQNPKARTLIEGHCDERGTNEYNLALGERRAAAARAYLVSKGIEPGRLSIVSYGEERPACAEHNEACWKANRRDHFLTKAE